MGNVQSVLWKGQAVDVCEEEDSVVIALAWRIGVIDVD
jgi:hypothetical protein